MKAIHGGKAKKDKIDSRKIAGLMRGGMFPLAYRQYDMERPDPFDSCTHPTHRVYFRLAGKHNPTFYDTLAREKGL